MPISRCSDQKDISLHEFYEEAKQHPGSEKMAITMQEIVRWIEETFETTEIFGLTSHYQLHLLSENDAASESYVRIIADPIRYYVDYLMPPEISPWEGAYVTGWTDNLGEAKRYILIAMKNSQGWIGSEELAKKYQ